MHTEIRSALCIALLALFSQSALAQGAGSVTYPRTLKADELQKLYGEREATIEAGGARGGVRYSLWPDGRLQGAKEGMVGGAAAKAANSSGKWLVDAAAGKVCHEWSNPRWENGCAMVVETAPGSYEWSQDGQPSGRKFTIRAN